MTGTPCHVPFTPDSEIAQHTHCDPLQVTPAVLDVCQEAHVHIAPMPLPSSQRELRAHGTIAVVEVAPVTLIPTAQPAPAAPTPAPASALLDLVAVAGEGVGSAKVAPRQVSVLFA